MPSVSVIIPTFNSAKYLPNCIQSVLSQTYTDFEIIVVDDGSTDNTTEALSSYEGKIRYIYQENARQAKARNTGMQVASGEFFAFLDSDDSWAPHMLANQIAAFELDENLGMVFADAQVVDDNTGESQSFWKRRGVFDDLVQRNGYLDEAFRLLLEKNFIPTGTVVVKKTVLDQVGHFDESLPPVEDKDLWLRISHDFPIRGIPKDLMIKRGFSTKDYERLKVNVLRVLEKMERLYPHTIAKMSDVLKKTRARIHGDLADYYWQTGDLRRTRQECRESLRNSISMKTIKIGVGSFGGKPLLTCREFARGVKRMLKVQHKTS